jgi:acyl-coenzyme A thioesterase PaaI-like protein
VRELVDATYEAAGNDDEQLKRAAEDVERLAVQLRAGAGSRGAARAGQSPMVGSRGPTSAPLRYERALGRVDGRGTFGAAYEGPPGAVHGGWIAHTFDEVLGMTSYRPDRPAVTARLSVRYRRPTPLHREVHLEAWAERVDGRRVLARGRITVDGTVTAEAEGLFVQLA